MTAYAQAPVVLGVRDEGPGLDGHVPRGRHAAGRREVARGAAAEAGGGGGGGGACGGGDGVESDTEWVRVFKKTHTNTHEHARSKPRELTRGRSAGGPRARGPHALRAQGRKGRHEVVQHGVARELHAALVDARAPASAWDFSARAREASCIIASSVASRRAALPVKEGDQLRPPQEAEAAREQVVLHAVDLDGGVAHELLQKLDARVAERGVLVGRLARPERHGPSQRLAMRAKARLRLLAQEVDARGVHELGTPLAHARRALGGPKVVKEGGGRLDAHVRRHARSGAPSGSVVAAYAPMRKVGSQRISRSRIAGRRA